jgi:hypothetical protein
MAEVAEYDATEFDNFAFVVDGEVAVTHSFHRLSMPAHCAALSSEPQVVLIPQELVGQVDGDWVYVDGEFRRAV